VRAVAPAAVGLGLGFAATVVHPYGVTLWTFLLTTVRVSRDLTEWHPVWQQEGPTETVTWLIVSAAIVIPTVVKHRRAVSWAAALPLGWLAVISLLVARMLPIYGEVALLCLADAWRSSNGKLSPSAPRGNVVATRRARPSGFMPLVIDALVVIAIAAANLVPQSRGLTTDRSWIPDYEAAAGIGGSYAAGRLVVPYDWGGFALWHWGPRLRVSVDPRRETVYSERTIAVQTDVEYGRPDGIAFLDRERPEYIWLPVPRAASVKAWARDHGYRIDVETGRSFVATRSDLPRLSPGPTLSERFP